LAAPLAPAAPAGGAGAPAVPVTGTGDLDGLPLDADGLHYFTLDGSGAPFEARIDIPLAEYESMSFDGELWALGTDYQIREGSTILVIPAARLVGLPYGRHEIAAGFTGGRTVTFAFDLRDAAGPAGVGADAGAGGARAPTTSPAPSPPVEDGQAGGSAGLIAALIAAAALAAALLLGAALYTRARRRAS
jgi:hypothetical protein